MAHGLLLVHRVRSYGVGRQLTSSGFVEPAESLEEAVRREALEETGVRVSQVAYHRCVGAAADDAHRQLAAVALSLIHI